MEYTAGNSFGYDQIGVETPLYFNKEDSSILLENRSRPENEVKQYLNNAARAKMTRGEQPQGPEAAFQYYLRKNIKDEIEKYEQRKPHYTGRPTGGMPESSGYPLCDHTPAEKPSCGGIESVTVCKACAGGGAMDYHKKYDEILFIILVVVAAFCMIQYTNIQHLQGQVQKLTTGPAVPVAAPAVA